MVRKANRELIDRHIEAAGNRSLILLAAGLMAVLVWPNKYVMFVSIGIIIAHDLLSDFFIGRYGR